MHGKAYTAIRRLTATGFAALAWVLVASQATADPYELTDSSNAAVCPEAWLVYVTWDTSSLSSKNADGCWTKSGTGNAANPTNPAVAGGGKGFSVEGEVFSFLDKVEGLPDENYNESDMFDGDGGQVSMEGFKLNGGVLEGEWSFSTTASQDVGAKNFLLVFKQGGGTSVQSGGTTMTAFLFNGVANAVAPYSGSFSMAWANKSGSLSNFTAWISEIPGKIPPEQVPGPATLTLLLVGLFFGRRRQIASR